SNFWFSSWQGLHECGRPAGWGGPWLADDVVAGQPSDAYLLAGFEKRVLHLAHQSPTPVEFILEAGSGTADSWKQFQTIEVSANGYRFVLLDRDRKEPWIRLRPKQNATGVTAYFHYGPGGGRSSDPSMFR